MRTPIIVGALLVLLIAAPLAVAQGTPKITMVLTGDLGSGSTYEIPRSSSVRSVNLTASLNADDLVCAQATELTVTAVIGAFPGWAGASVNPSPPSWRFTIPQGEPGVDPKMYTPSPARNLVLEMRWGEDAPASDIRAFYNLTTSTAGNLGSCAPTNIVVTEAELQIIGHMVALPPKPTGPTSSCADEFATLDECRTDTEPTSGPEPEGSPGVGTLGILVLLAVAVAAIKRRR